MTPSILGIVIAGGRSSRMGQDKAKLLLDGVQLGVRAAERLRPQVRALAFNGHAVPGLASDITVVTDAGPDHLGPLSGILAGLRLARELGLSHVATVPVDTPFFPQDLVQRLWTSLEGKEGTIAIVASEGDLHPIFGVWPSALADELALFLETDPKRRVRTFIERHPHMVVDVPADGGSDPIDMFLNMNMPEDIARAESVLRRIARGEA